jgi:superoxide dismutase, Cu-Zn family
VQYDGFKHRLLYFNHRVQLFISFTYFEINMSYTQLARLSALCCVGFISACANYGPNNTAFVQLDPTRGNNVSGSLQFLQHGDLVRVTGQLSGLSPNTEHGFHIHDKGDCSSGDGMSAAGHFNPERKPHGAHGQGEHHAGDIPSLKADAYGVAKVNFESSTISLRDDKSTNIIGHGVIVHKDADDYTTQPTGNSGARLACGVIKK